MGLLESGMESIEKEGRLILNETFMMNMFKGLVNELPPLSNYLKYLYVEKLSYLIGKPIPKAVPLAHRREELFLPKLETNQDTSNLAMKLG